MRKYTNEKHTRILIALLKKNNIRKVVASPGNTNVTFIGSLQNDTFFEIYSSVDERSAAYIACGLARESGEPVILSCTGATASRNYISGLTEAYYSNLPILAITSTQHPGRVGQLMPQVIDRSQPLNDIAKKSIQLNVVHSEEDEWAAQVKINSILLELKRGGSGPIHINLETTYSSDFSFQELPHVRTINRYFSGDILPSLSNKKIIINVGTHLRWSDSLTKAVDSFCEIYNAVVVCEHISNYKGQYGVYPSLLANQEGSHYSYLDVDIMIHIGTVLGFGAGGNINAHEVWRVHPDGEVRDTFKKLTKVFEMKEETFFNYYCEDVDKKEKNVSYYSEFSSYCHSLENKIGDLPFSNPWIAKNTISKLPQGCELHLGILNSLRSWSLFNIDLDKNIEIYSNTGGFGIDGLVSTLIGSSLASPEKLFIGIIGDLAFFYDMNALGNRHVGKNIRLMVINNGRGTEFRNYNHLAAKFGEDADAFMAAAGHFGNKSQTLIKHYAEDLGYKYLSAHNKQEYLTAIESFLDPDYQEKSIVFEVFTDSRDESEALNILYHLDVTNTTRAKILIKNTLSEKQINMIKKLIKK